MGTRFRGFQAPTGVNCQDDLAQRLQASHREFMASIRRRMSTRSSQNVSKNVDKESMHSVRQFTRSPYKVSIPAGRLYGVGHLRSPCFHD